MTCDGCGITMLKWLATKETPYAYTVSGLRDVYLRGIEVYRCAGCGLESPMIPQIESLHRVISNSLVKKATRLSGDQIRFLRKNAGFPSAAFAALIGVTPSHFSRVENGKHHGLSDSADKLARAYAAVAICGDDVRSALLKLGKTLARVSPSVADDDERKVVFALKGNHWEKAA